MRPLRVTGASTVAADLNLPIICNGLSDGFNGSLKWIPKRMHLRFEFAYCLLLFVYHEFPQTSLMFRPLDTRTTFALSRGTETNLIRRSRLLTLTPWT